MMPYFLFMGLSKFLDKYYYDKYQVKIVFGNREIQLLATRNTTASSIPNYLMSECFIR